MKTLSNTGEEGMTGCVGFSLEPLLTENLDKTREKELHFWHPSWSIYQDGILSLTADAMDSKTTIIIQKQQ